MAGATKLPTLDSLERLAMRAASGDADALRELGNTSERLARTANKRMRRLEKAGKTGDAYKRISDSIGGKTRFSQAHTGSAEQLYRNAQKSLAALEYKESTLSGIKEVNKETAESIFNHFGMLEDGQELTQTQVNKFNRFLESKAWPDVKKVFGSDALQMVADMVLNEDPDYEEMILAMNEWAEQEADDRASLFAVMDGYLEF